MIAERIQATVDMFRRSCRDNGYFVTGDDRVTEPVAAALLGYAAGTLKNKRDGLDGPPSYKRGMDGRRVSYRLADLAQWVEGGRVDIETLR